MCGKTQIQIYNDSSTPQPSVISIIYYYGAIRLRTFTFLPPKTHYEWVFFSFLCLRKHDTILHKNINYYSLRNSLVVLYLNYIIFLPIGATRIKILGRYSTYNKTINLK